MTGSMAWVVLVAMLLALTGALLSWTAGRLDRLHTRVEGARAALDAQLFHRSGAALELAMAGALDPATSLVMLDAAHNARAADDREVAESELTRTLANAFSDPAAGERLCSDADVGPLVAELGASCRKVQVARRVHNDTVASTMALRGRGVVRWARLAGHADAPPMVEIVDDVPAGLQT